MTRDDLRGGAALAIVVLCGLLGTAPATAQTARPLSTDWFDEDEWHRHVRYLITAAERDAYEHLTTAADRDRFIAEFWARRDPTPGTQENEFRTEFERRVAYTDATYADPANPAHSGMETERGHIYILFGPPDAVMSFSGGAYELWRYTQAPMNGVTIKFSVPPISSCDGAYRVYTNRTVSTARAGATSVVVDPGRLVTFRIRTDFSDLVSIAHTLRTAAGAPVLEGDGAFWDGQLGPAGNDPLSNHILDCRMFESGGLGFTHPLAAGSYVLSTTRTSLTGKATTERVTFDVR